MKVSMLTTIDNPYDPFDQFEEWYAFDEQMGYHSSGYVARIAKTSSELNPLDQNVEITNAINEIVNLNLLGIYKKVERDFDDLPA